MIVYVFGLNFDDGFVLLNRQLQYFLRLAAGLHVTQRTQIDASQKLSGIQITGIAFDDFLGFQDGIANASGFSVQFSQPGIQVFRRRIILDGQPVLFNGFVRVLGTAIHGHHLFVHVGQAIVIISRRPVYLLRDLRLCAGRSRGIGLLISCRGISATVFLVSRRILLSEYRNGGQEET